MSDDFEAPLDAIDKQVLAIKEQVISENVAREKRQNELLGALMVQIIENGWCRKENLGHLMERYIIEEVIPSTDRFKDFNDLRCYFGDDWADSGLRKLSDRTFRKLAGIIDKSIREKREMTRNEKNKS